MKHHFPSSDTRSPGLHSQADVVLDEVAHHQVVAQLGKVHGPVLVLGEDVAVGAVLQQEAHYVDVSPLARLKGKGGEASIGGGPRSSSHCHSIRIRGLKPRSQTLCLNYKQAIQPSENEMNMFMTPLV